jgi:hypothetical protein
MTKTVTFSTLLREPNKVIASLEEGDVVLTRRDGEPLRISKERDAEREHEMTRAFAQMLGALVLDDDQSDRLLDRLRIPFGWLDFLSADEQRNFAEEFFRTARASAAAGNFERLAIEIANWHETAVAYSLGLRERLDTIQYLDDDLVAEDPRTK